jgi:hypothetical protein
LPHLDVTVPWTAPQHGLRSVPKNPRSPGASRPLPAFSFASAFSFLSAIVLTLFSLATPVQAQTYEFVGTLYDDIRGEPIGGAEIFTLDGRKLGVSQPSGRFEVTVNNRKAIVVFKREGFRDQEQNLGDLARIIDVDVVMEASVRELEEVTTYAPRRALDPSQAQSIEELESLQGMRMDLNDHLRQMHGVAGMNEFTGDISIHGSRTQDVTHYLGKSRVPSLRHLEFGFPGNQSVLNPRLLKSVTLADNPAKGPINQGNASALVYDLQEGDPEAIRGDIVLGSTNRELNLSSYWGKRTNLFSARYLDPNGLGALGRQFFTSPKDERITDGQGCQPDRDPPCKTLSDPLRFSSLDIFFSTFKRDTTGSFARHTLIVLDDNYEVVEDKSVVAEETKPQTLVDGFQGAWLYSYESIRPVENGEWEWGFSYLSRRYDDSYRDTLPPAKQASARPWYPVSGIDDVENLIGEGGRRDRQFILSSQWSPTAQVFGAAPSYGLELEHTRQTRGYQEIALSTSGNPSDSSINRLRNLERDVTLANALYRLRWSLGGGRSVEASAGAAIAYEAWRLGEEGGLLTPLPVASVRYTQPLNKEHSAYIESALRQSVVLEPTGRNMLAAKATPSAEVKIGGNGFIFTPLRYAWSGYTRYYQNPALPSPEVYWNYAEIREAENAQVHGANLTLNYLPGHHAGMGVNASIIQGAYKMRDGGSLPWESNRALDLVTNLRILPRDDSLFSFIITYGIQNGAPLYEHDSMWVWTNQATNQGYSTSQRYVRQNSGNPTVSRQRLDARVNLDLKSAWRPLESMRFFFEATNIFADFDNGPGAWLGGRNERRRGWTRSGDNGELEPVVTKGLGLFLMFGIEGKLKI